MKLLLASQSNNVIGKTLPFLLKPPQECKTICIPTAAMVEDGFDSETDECLADMRKAGFLLTLCDLAEQTEQSFAEIVKDADIVYVRGGNTFYLLEKMRACGFEKTIRAFLERGGFYIGSSAGSIVTCPDIDYVRPMEDPAITPDLADTSGLNLVDFYVVVHMDNTEFGKEAPAIAASMKERGLPVYCLNDDQAVFVDGKSVTLI